MSTSLLVMKSGSIERERGSAHLNPVPSLTEGRVRGRWLCPCIFPRMRREHLRWTLFAALLSCGGGGDSTSDDSVGAGGSSATEVSGGAGSGGSGAGIGPTFGGSGGAGGSVALGGAGGVGSPDAGSSMQPGMDAGAVHAVAPYDCVGVIGTGQSLGTGYTINGGPARSTTQPFHNLMLADSGPDPKFPSDGSGMPVWSAVPLVEPMRPQFANLPAVDYPNNIAGETPHSGMANMLSSISQARMGGDYVSAHTNVSIGGRALIYINKDTPSFRAALNEARVFKKLAEAAGKTYGVAGITLTHGEADSDNPVYGAGVFQLWQDFNDALKAATGQTRDVVMFASQQSSSDGINNSAVQIWRAGVDHPGKIICVGPKYQYAYADGVHLPQAGYTALGEKYGEVFDLVVNQSVPWKPIAPKSVTRAGATLTIALDVPNPPLTWDPNISAPHAKAHTGWANGRGFEILDEGGNELTISSAQITGPTTVVLTLASAPSGKLTLSYAVTGDAHGCCWGGYPEGARGQLRDSDDLVGYDAEMISVQVTNGSAQARAPSTALLRRAGGDVVKAAGLPADTIIRNFTTDGFALSSPWTGATGTASLSFHHDLHNHAVHFSMPVP